MSRGAISKQFPATWLPEARSTMAPSFRVVEPGHFRLIGGGTEIVATAGCRVVVLKEERKEQLDLPADICDERSPFLEHLRYSEQEAIAPDRGGNTFALALNIGSRPRLFLFRDDNRQPYF